MEAIELKRVLETALICSGQALSMKDLRLMLAEVISEEEIMLALNELQLDWQHRGVELAHVASGWRFQSKPEMRDYLERLNPEKPPKFTRAVLETLAIIAFKQPVTRGDIEDIRGVTVNAQIIKQLEDRGWIEVIGHRETVGRPSLFATTRHFLDDLGLASLSDLPPLQTLTLDKLSQLNLEPAELELALTPSADQAGDRPAALGLTTLDDGGQMPLEATPVAAELTLPSPDAPILQGPAPDLPATEGLSTNVLAIELPLTGATLIDVPDRDMSSNSSPTHLQAHDVTAESLNPANPLENPVEPEIDHERNPIPT